MAQIHLQAQNYSNDVNFFFSILLFRKLEGQDIEHTYAHSE